MDLRERVAGFRELDERRHYGGILFLNEKALRGVADPAVRMAEERNEFCGLRG